MPAASDDAAPAISAASLAAGAGAHNTYLYTWETRPGWVREASKNYGSTELHYLLGMFGVTADFNDAPDTTLEALHARLNEAAAWAESHNIPASQYAAL